MRESREISRIYDYDGVAAPESGGKSPVIPNTRKISGLLEAVAILGCSVITARYTRGEACHWILGRLRLPMNPVPLPPLEMTMNVWIHRDKGGFSERNPKAALPNLCAATFIPNSSFLIPNFFPPPPLLTPHSSFLTSMRRHHHS